MSARSGEQGIPYCPRCDSQDIWRNGFNCAGKQQWRCKSCGRVFVLDPYLPDYVRVIADRMILEGIPVMKIANVLQGFASRRWIYKRKGEKYVH